MAQFKQGPLGNASGKVGNVSISKWKDKTIVRGRKSGSTKPASKRQLEQRAKVAVVGKFLRNVKEVVSTCYRDNTGKMTSYNAASRNLLINAITGEYPDYGIDFSLVEVSRGEIKQLFKPAVTSPKTDVLAFTWTTDSGIGKSKPSDKAVLVVYCDKIQVAAFTLEGPPRSAGAAELAMPGFSGQVVHAWVAFISEDGSHVCNSVYAGRLTIT